MSATLSACPVCNGNDLPKYMEVKDYSVSKENFQLVKCGNCGFIFTNPRPTASEIGKYYQSDDYISHTNSSKGIQNKLYQAARKFAISGKMKLIEKLDVKQQNLLDYGCGTGEFLGAAKAAGWEVQGMELDPLARQKAIHNHQLKVTEPDELNSIPDKSVGLITLWHVLEHVHELQTTIQHFQRVLIPGGQLVIAVPNCESSDAKTYGAAWAAYDVPRHLYHFTKPVMQRLMKNNGFKMQQVKGMFFDPFYISLLSEKYKYGSINPLRAGWNGVVTNIRGRNDVSLNSSLLYVFVKQVR